MKDMSEKTITVEIPESTARAFTGLPWQGTEIMVIKGAIEKALPPEYPEGTIAWVTSASGVGWLSERRDGAWRRATRGVSNSHVTVEDGSITKVDVLRVLAKDEIAVKRIGSGNENEAHYLRKALDSSSTLTGDRAILAYLEALEKEQGK